MRRLAIVSTVTLGLVACGSKDVSPDPDLGGGEATDASSADDDDDDDASVNDDTSASGDTTGSANDDDAPPPEPLPPPPATGIQIVEVTVDQGIRVPVVRGGEMVGPADRNQPILRDRPAVVRAFYDVDPGYATRQIYALLHVHQLDDSVTTYENFMQTSESACDQPYIYDCRYGGATGSFVWRIPGDVVVPGVRYRIEMLETSPGHENDVSDKIPEFPIDGSLMIMGVEESYMKMRVVLVPFQHALGSQCDDAPNLLEEYGTDIEGNPRTIADFFGERLLAHNPVDEVEIVVHDVVPFGGSMKGSQPLSALQQLRAQENAPPEYFYYGVGIPCDGGPDFSGLAQLGGPSPDLASQRVGWGVWHSSVSTTADTFVHEIGHEQGRQHIRCNGEEAGADSSYPDHPEGDTESWGADIMSQPVSIKPPSSHDYMTYCGSTWVSEWAWSKVLPWIQTMSQWELAGMAPSPAAKQPLLFGRVAEDGDHEWWIAEDWYDPSRASAQHRLQLSVGGATLADTPVVWTEYEHTNDWQVIAPLPAGLSLSASAWASLDRIAIETPERAIDIDKGMIAVIGTATTSFAAAP